MTVNMAAPPIALTQGLRRDPIPLLNSLVLTHIIQDIQYKIVLYHSYINSIMVEDFLIDLIKKD